MERSKRALEDLTCLEELLFNDMQSDFVAKRVKMHRFTCQGAVGCGRTPIYGTVSRQPTHCTEHRDVVTMVNVMSRLCQHPSMCFTQASFGYEKGKPLRCKSHMESGMLNVISKRCEEDFCLMIPCFGFERGLALRCAAHKLQGMWNVTASTCNFLGCTTFATYGYMSKKSIRCSTHRLPDMYPTKLLNSLNEMNQLHMKQMAQYASPVEGERIGHCRVCGIRAFYGNSETHRAFCKQHMQPLKHWRISDCDRAGCDKVATHAKSNGTLGLHSTPTPSNSTFYCEEHSTPFSVCFAPVTGLGSGSTSDVLEAEVVHLDVNPLEQQVMQALNL